MGESALFHSRYRLLRQIGRGGFSEVKLATNIRIRLLITLKVYAAGMGLDNEGVQFFSEEFSHVFNMNKNLINR